MKDIQALLNLTKSTQQNLSKSYKNVLNSVQQCSVAVLFRQSNQSPSNKVPFPENQSDPHTVLQDILSNYEYTQNREKKSDIEMLFIKRSKNFSHAGDIAFPGGKLENDESDYDACLREVKEELNIDIEKESEKIYLGRLEPNFFCYYRKNQEVRLSVHSFFVKSDIGLKISPDEIDSAFWLPIDTFLYPSLRNIGFQKTKTNPIEVLAKNNNSFFGKYWHDSMNNFQDMDLPNYKLPNNEILYGITFYIVIYMMRVMTNECTLISESRSTQKKMLEQLHDLKINLASGSNFNAKLAEKLYFHKKILQFFSPLQK